MGSSIICIIKIGIIMRQFFTSREEYIFVLKNEVEILRRFYYKPDGQATGHYNTAIGVLEERIKVLQSQIE
jgi:hypothetical protein